MTSSRRIETQNLEHQQRSGELIQVKQKAINQHPFDDATDNVVRAFNVTRFSRLQVLKGLAAMSAIAMLPSLASRSVVAQTTGGSTTTGAASWWSLQKEKFRDRSTQVREAMIMAQINQIYRDYPNADLQKVANAMAKFRQEFDRQVLDGRITVGQVAKNTHRLIRDALGIAESLDLGAALGLQASFNPDTFIKGVYEIAVNLPWLQNEPADFIAVWTNMERYEKWFPYGSKIPGFKTGLL
jgi:hypothetical protein